MHVFGEGRAISLGSALAEAVCAYIGEYGAILILRMEWPCPPFFSGVMVAPCMLISCTDCSCSASVIMGTRVVLPAAVGLQVVSFFCFLLILLLCLVLGHVQLPLLWIKI